MVVPEINKKYSFKIKKIKKKKEKKKKKKKNRKERDNHKKVRVKR